MTAALALAREGIPSVLLDNKNTFNDGSRAICIERQSLYILQYVGAVTQFLAKALPWTLGRSFYRGHPILEFEMADGPDEKYRPMYNLQQQFVESYLHDAVAASGLIEMRWQSEVVALDDLADGVELTVRDPEGVYDLPADWVLACDGARSAVRKMRGLRLEGENFEGRYVIADVRMRHEYPTIRRALFDPPSRPGGTVLIHRQPESIWRIDYQLFAHERTDDALAEGTIRTVVAAVLQDLGHQGEWELEWWSVYTANTLTLQDYRHGRISFVGDSAHIVPIFGVRGLNNGLADAINIGWKLGWVLNGKAGIGLLDSYTPERRGATLNAIENASKSAYFMTPPDHGWRTMRDAALSLALTEPFAGQLANPRQMQAHVYSDSPAVLPDQGEFSRGPKPGMVLPEVRIGEGFLSELCGAGFTALCFDRDVAQSIRALNDARLEAVALPHESRVATLYDADRESIYLIRPDRYVAARWKRGGPDLVRQALAVCVGRGGPDEER
jgi:3-(3-hydroxy-phenyl)propionate hydroxylase